jgi:isoleucyl-tRNA synthetase
LPARAHDSVFFATWADLAPIAELTPLSTEELDLIRDLEALRTLVNKEIERLRNEGVVGGSLEAAVSVATRDFARHAALARVAPELRFFFITSEALLAPPGSNQFELVGAGVPGQSGTQSGSDWSVLVTPTDHSKCVRCWHRRADVGADAAHPELCGRCVENVAGDGESRRWF